MQKVVLILMVLISTNLNVFSQINESPQFNTITKRVGNTNGVYQLYATQNIWTFIKLNTRNGLMWQVQFDVQGDNRFEASLNPKPLVASENEVTDRFTLYPTQNRWTFILLDQIDGKTWQVQWSMDGDKNLVIPIQ